MLSRCARSVSRAAAARSSSTTNCALPMIGRNHVPGVAGAAGPSFFDNSRNSNQQPRGRRALATVREAATVDDALRFSGYSEIDFTISEDAVIYEAVQKFAAFNIGCLVTVDAAGAFTVSA